MIRKSEYVPVICVINLVELLLSRKEGGVFAVIFPNIVGNGMKLGRISVSCDVRDNCLCSLWSRK